jgi:hypothetical protein
MITMFTARTLRGDGGDVGTQKLCRPCCTQWQRAGPGMEMGLDRRVRSGAHGPQALGLSSPSLTIRCAGPLIPVIVQPLSRSQVPHGPG